MADPKAPEMVDGWKWDGFTNFASYVHRNVEVSFDGESLETSETVSGYEGYTSRVSVSLPLLRALLTHLGLHIVTEAEKGVLDACAAIPWDFNEAGNRVHGLLWERADTERIERAELARRRRCKDCGMVTPAEAAGQLHHIGCGTGARTP